MTNRTDLDAGNHFAGMPATLLGAPPRFDPDTGQPIWTAIPEPRVHGPRIVHPTRYRPSLAPRSAGAVVGRVHPDTDEPISRAELVVWAVMGFLLGFSAAAFLWAPA